MRAITTAAVATACLASLTAPALAQPQSFIGLQYGDGHPRQLLDIYLPAGPIVQRPMVIYIHGGGWRTGSRTTANSGGRVTELLARGFAVASIDYRLSGDATFPAQIHDCKAAIRYLRMHAAVYGIDPDRIAVWGTSAGGHLAALLGTSGDVAAAEGAVGAASGNLAFSSRVQAVADFFGPTDMLGIAFHLECNSAESLLLGACLGDIQANINNPAWSEQVENARLASSITHVTPDDSPFYIAHGVEDGTVPVEHSTRIHAALLAAGVPAAIRLVPGAGHGLPVIENYPAYAFFVDTVGRCPADWDRSGGVDGDDIGAFFADWQAGNADIDGSGGTDGDDITRFFERWQAGC